MLSVEEAKRLLFGQVELMSAVDRKVTDTLGFVLAADVCAPIDLPSFDQSAMDGYAVNVEPFPAAEHLISLPVKAEMKAGDKPLGPMQKNAAIRIFTGAAVPENAHCIVVQEKVEVNAGDLKFSAAELRPNANIRKRGSQIKAGELAVKAGMHLNPAAIGWLSSLGITSVPVFAKPLVSVLATGNELKKPGSTLSEGQIYESNSFALKAALEHSNFKTLTLKSVPDQLQKTFAAIQKMLQASDILIISGGISVGKYDLVKDTLFSLGVEQILYKIAQKPGKPMFVGKYDKDHHRCMVFALPGNPAAALVCFYEYVLPALKKMSGFTEILPRTAMLPLQNDFEIMGDRALFLRAFATETGVQILEGQDSNMMRSFAASNAIVYIPVNSSFLKKGQSVETHFLP